MRPEDLIPAFLDIAKSLRLCRDDRSCVQRIRRIERMSTGTYGECSHGYLDADDAAEDLETLFDLLNNYVPDYCYFGAHPGDGADYGVWVVEELLTPGSPQGGYDGLVYRCTEDFEQPGPHVPKSYTHFLSVTDHGNCTLYRRAGRRWIEVWSIV